MSKEEIMKEYQIAVVAGDGIGPEVMAECKKVLEAAASLDGSFRFLLILMGCLKLIWHKPSIYFRLLLIPMGCLKSETP